jgi:hypothetical protein
MYVARTRVVPFSEEKLLEKRKKPYYEPARYSSKQKTLPGVSACVKSEDFV